VLLHPRLPHGNVFVFLPHSRATPLARSHGAPQPQLAFVAGALPHLGENSLAGHQFRSARAPLAAALLVVRVDARAVDLAVLPLGPLVKRVGGAHAERVHELYAFHLGRRPLHDDRRAASAPAPVQLHANLLANRGRDEKWEGSLSQRRYLCKKNW
jgi:hypothetical protein